MSSSDISDSGSEYEDCGNSEQNELVQNISSTEETDAALRTNVSLPRANDVIDMDKVYQIEDQLQMEDIVSLMFLLSENEETEYFLQSLSLLLSGGNRKILSEWARHHSFKTNWQNKLIEALCIIKHFGILKSLGYEKSKVSLHYLPNSVNCIHVNKIRKAVYLICDSMGLEDTESFLSHVREKYKKRNIRFEEYHTEMLELYFLKWESNKFPALSEIKDILKNMCLEHGYNILDSVLSPISERKVPQIPRDSRFLPESENGKNINTVNSRTRTQSSTSVDNNVPRRTSPFGRQNSEFHSSLMQPLGLDVVNKNRNKNIEPRYDIDHQNPGVILIINQQHFYTEIDENYKDLLPSDTRYPLPPRKGSEKDKERLKKVFESMGFKVIIKDSIRHIEMIQEIKNVVKGITEESSLFICIMSHGENGVVYGSNSCYVKISKIQEIMCSYNKTNLGGKPKVLLLQSCQGQQCQTLDSEYENEDEMSLTTDGPVSLGRDFLIFWATIPGFAAIRDKNNGSWFIQAFCKKLFEFANTNHFADICTRTAAEVADQLWVTREKDKKVMTSKVESTFIKSFYLPPLKYISSDSYDMF